VFLGGATMGILSGDLDPAILPLLMDKEEVQGALDIFVDRICNISILT
jgi:acetate kinase